MANFTKLVPIDMGNLPNIPTNKVLASDVYTSATTNGKTTATYGVYFNMQERDDKYLIVLKNSAASGAITATIKAGNSGKWSSGDNDIVIGAGEISFIKVESGRYKNETDNEELTALGNIGESLKGCVVVTAPATGLDVAVIKMPF